MSVQGMTLIFAVIFFFSNFFADNKPDVKDKLKQVEYSSRFAIGVYFDKDTALDIPWTSKYIEGDPCIRFISIDSKKRNAGKN